MNVINAWECIAFPIAILLLLESYYKCVQIIQKKKTWVEQYCLKFIFIDFKSNTSIFVLKTKHYNSIKHIERVAYCNDKVSSVECYCLLCWFEEKEFFHLLFKNINVLLF